MRVPIIGQQPLLAQIDRQIEQGAFPQFVIIAGDAGSGKTLVAQYIAEKLDAQAITVGKSVDDVREVIDTVRRVTDRVACIFRRAENMSAQAMNALLKILEEPPKGVYFLFTTCNDALLLSTIRSRGAILRMCAYMYEELCEYNQGEPVSAYCKTPRDVDRDKTATGLDTFANLVVANIATVPLVNAMKIADKIDLDDSDPTKYDLRMFLRAFNLACMREAQGAGARKYTEAVTRTSELVNSVKPNSNLHMLFDAWMLETRWILG